ncbi:MAG: hypothetical protein ABS79_04970 [Planctomycetes bacterium SCN 63-9]|nr:MAG: hypothetical protein ABS79_04970 [Planctomycetes bacterium SCN 63-9]
MGPLSNVFATPSPGYPSRRDFLRRTGSGIGLLALADLAEEAETRAVQANPGSPNALINPLDPMSPRAPHFQAKAKSVIWLFLNGGPSQVDTWDYKPELARRNGQELQGFDQKTGFFAGAAGPLMASPFRFERRGASGTWVPEIFPMIASHVDDMAFIHSCFTDTNNHSPALFQMNTGMSRMGFPGVGSWVTYGLGSESRNLPGFVVMYDTKGRGLPKGNASNWGAGFLPGVFQGTALNPQGAPIDNLSPLSSMNDDRQRAQLDFLKRLNRRNQSLNPEETALSARIESFELAYRMQMTAPEAIDVENESEPTRQLYGLDRPECGHFARQCLIARRLVERGVRFVQIYSGGMENERSWDGHTDIAKNHRGFAAETDRPIAALLTDLKSRGLIDSTLVVCNGEFGRLPLVQKGGTGRDHNPHAFTTWFAGGGIKGGVHHGETDEIGHKAAVNRVSVNDLHATILRLLGLDHTRLTYRFNGRDFRLTDVAGNVVSPIIG